MKRLTPRSLAVLILVPLALTFAQLGLAKEPQKEEKQESGALPSSWTKALHWRSIGPANMGGRIVALAVNPKDSSNWWVATASGGLLKTINNGVTFEHQFDKEATVSIGDVAVSESHPNILWVGTGEANPRNSVSWGDGVYKSEDGGKTWTNMGLRNCFQVGRIAIHPTNPNIVYVGALGRLWGENEERGLYKTMDGGKSWKRILYVDQKTGIIDIQLKPGDPDTFLVASYERQRDGYDVNAPAKKVAPGSLLWKTTDGGDSFKKIRKGLPPSLLGRIGLCYYEKNPEVVYALVECEEIGKAPANAAYMGVELQNSRGGAVLSRVIPGGAAAKAGLKSGDKILEAEGKAIRGSRDLSTLIQRHLAGDTVPLKVLRGKKRIAVSLTFGARPRSPNRNPRQRQRKPFETSLGGQRANIQNAQGKDGWKYGGLYRSADGGESWTRINSINPRPMYFSQVRVDPSNEKYLYVLGVSTSFSKDGGKTFQSSRGIHPDSHALWINPKDGRHMILGTDGGHYVTYDRMARWDHFNHSAIGQFYKVAVDSNKNYKVYGGLQDNGSWGGPNRSSGAGPINSDWFRVYGGDGFVCQVDPKDPNLIYYESQNGGLGRIHLKTGKRASIKPRAPRGQRPYRFNWNTPFILSNFNSKVYYTAGNYVFRSVNKGDRLQKISPEISATRRGSATALAESSQDENVLYVGTDDGALWVTKNGGRNWTSLIKDPRGPKKTKKKKKLYFIADGSSETAKVNQGSSLDDLLPGRRWVNNIECSQLEAGRAYVVFDGHRSNDDEIYIFVTDDYGQSWRSLRGNLPKSAGTARVIREDLVNPNVLYLGCEFSAWVSIDRGETWTKFNANLPTVAVHDFALHPSSGEIVAATHGRSLWICDVSGLRQLSAKTVKSGSHLYKIQDRIVWRFQPTRGATNRRFVGENPKPGAAIYYSHSAPVKSAEIRVLAQNGALLYKTKAKKAEGFHRFQWAMRRGPTRASIERRYARQLREMAPKDREQAINRMLRGRGVPVNPGTYVVELIVDGQSQKQTLKIERDPETESDAWMVDEEWSRFLKESEEEDDDTYGEGEEKD